MEECEHPFDQLDIDVGRAGQRGASDLFHVSCLVCEGRFPSALGVRVLIQSGVQDSRLIWRAILALGGSKPVAKVAAPAAPGEPAPCAHFLTWLCVEGSAPGRGVTGSVHVRCAGCKALWGQPDGLKLFHKRVMEDRAAVKRVIRELGGAV